MALMLLWGVSPDCFRVVVSGRGSVAGISVMVLDKDFYHETHAVNTIKFSASLSVPPFPKDYSQVLWLFHQ